MSIRPKYYFLWILYGCVFTVATSAQAQHRKYSIRDSLDHAIDLSDWIINAHGFIPVPYLITEPAVGIGGAVVPLMIAPHRQTAEYRKHKNLAPIPPDITGAAIMYTANKTWALGAGRMGTIVKWKLRYSGIAAYTNVNLKYYRDVLGEEKTFKFNFKSIPAFLRLQRQIGYSNWSAGIQYLYTHTEGKLLTNTDLPLIDSFFMAKQFTNTTSVAGALIEFDKRDNTFTPNKGSKLHVAANWSNQALGSDFNYVHMTGYLYKYIPFSSKWICGLRADMEQVLGDAPFYFLPSIDLRGVAKARYQGKTNTIVETEQRWNFVTRWSAVFYTGVGKAFNDYSKFGDAPWVYSYGTGFRYLIARKLKLYMGADIARGPDQWGYYVQFGSAWLK